MASSQEHICVCDGCIVHHFTLEATVDNVEPEKYTHSNITVELIENDWRKQWTQPLFRRVHAA